MVLGKIYKIISGQGNECYVGSTFDELRYRFRKHKYQYNEWKINSQNVIKLSSFNLFEKYGVENCKMILIKEYDVIDRKHLQAYETLWICKLQPNNINKTKPLHIPKLYRKSYNHLHKDKIKKYKHIWHKMNYKYDKTERHHKYIKNKDILLEKQRQKRKNTNQSKKCECGSDYTISNKSRHIKSKKHQNWLNNQKTE